MSTRGAYGFRQDNVDKVTYNHSDSYPTYLGEHVLTFVKNHVNELPTICKGLRLVRENGKPGKRAIKKYGQDAGFVDGGDYENLTWYDLLRVFQGVPRAWTDDGVGHIIDNSRFLDDSLFCEWAYIINLDAACLEIYKGYNKNPHAPGRYANHHCRHAGDYYGVELIREIPLLEIAEMDPEEISEICSQIEEEAYK